MLQKIYKKKSKKNKNPYLIIKRRTTKKSHLLISIFMQLTGKMSYANS